MVIFVRVGRRQFVARNVELNAVQALGVLTLGDAFQRRDQMAFCLAGGRNFELARAVLGRERAVTLHGERVLGKRPQFYGAAHAVCGSDSRAADGRCHSARGRAYFLAAAAAAVLAAAAVAVAAVAAASALAL